VIVSLSQLTTNVTSGNTCWTIITNSTTHVRVLEIGIFLNAATASTFGLGRPAAVGITPTSPVDFLPEDNADVFTTGSLQACLTWSTLPTVPTNSFRRVGLPAAVGAGIIWTFPKGILIPISGNLVIHNLATNGAANVYAVVDL
jgi:hypothetical protein